MNSILKKLLGVLILASMSFSWMFAQNTSNDNDPLYVPGELYVKFKNQSKIAPAIAVNTTRTVQSKDLNFSEKTTKRLGIKAESRSMRFFNNPVLANTYKIRFDEAVDLDEAIAEFQKDPRVEYAEKVTAHYITSLPASASSVMNDPYYATIDGMKLNWNLEMVDAEKAWELQTGNASVKVAVVDNAIWKDHPDLELDSANMYNTYTDKVGNSSPDADQECTNYYSCAAYDWSHGTHCAGVIGAINNNGVGIASLAGGVTLMGISCPLPGSPRSVYGGYEGIMWAAENGANIISCSWGSKGKPSSTERDVMQTCMDQNIIVVVAAGNENTNELQSPASLENVISVASVDENTRKSSFSNYGSWVDVAAPGGFSSNGSSLNPSYKIGIFSTTFCDNFYMKAFGITGYKYYDDMQGTSMACPMVSAVCALLRSYNPDLTPDQVKSILQKTAKPLDKNSLYSYVSRFSGIVNAYEALKYAQTNPEFIPAVTDLKAEVLVDSASLSWAPAVSVSGMNFLGYTVYEDGIGQFVSDTHYHATFFGSGNYTFHVEALYKKSNDTIRSSKAKIVVTVEPFFKITLRSKPEEGGQLVGAGKYTKNTWVELQAIPNEGYAFVEWTDGFQRVSDRPTYTILVRENKTYFANFKTTSNEGLNQMESVKITPNPSKDMMRITAQNNISKVQVISLSGHVIMESIPTNGHEAILNISSLPKGLYIVNVVVDGEIFRQKITKL